MNISLIAVINMIAVVATGTCHDDVGPMKTASLGLLEVRVVRVNAGGDAPPDPPSVGDDTGPFPPFF